MSGLIPLAPRDNGMPQDLEVGCVHSEQFNAPYARLHGFKDTLLADCEAAVCQIDW